MCAAAGILAEEMGLGKTVEVLALVSANRFLGTYQASGHVNFSQQLPGTCTWRTRGALSRTLAGASIDLIDLDRRIRAIERVLESESGAYIQIDFEHIVEQELSAVDAGVERRERVACICGATEDEGGGGGGLWLQCDTCDAWLHADCCGFRRPPHGALVAQAGNGSAVFVSRIAPPRLRP